MLCEGLGRGKRPVGSQQQHHGCFPQALPLSVVGEQQCWRGGVFLPSPLALKQPQTGLVAAKPVGESKINQDLYFP